MRRRTARRARRRLGNFGNRLGDSSEIPSEEEIERDSTR
tara:strand:- start:50 stop:166 length:117 start_codon:yes stop_codon:yes gene_type:complete